MARRLALGLIVVVFFAGGVIASSLLGLMVSPEPMDPLAAALVPMEADPMTDMLDMAARHRAIVCTFVFGIPLCVLLCLFPDESAEWVAARLRFRIST